MCRFLIDKVQLFVMLGGMFVREKQIGPYRYVYLVESVRENGRIKQRIIKNLGRKEQVEANGDLDRLGRETGCHAVIESLAAERSFGFALERACFLTVLHRLMVSGSDRAADAWRDDYRIEGTEGLALHHLYRTMAWLGAELPAGEQAGRTPFAPRCTKDLVEERLFEARRDLFSELSVVFLDTPSLYFEGAGGETLGQRGHSKDHRPDLMQMIVAVVMDQRGRPICCEMWPGNTTDVTALMPVVDRLGRRFGIPRVCVVADRGMISAETIAALEARGLEYILGVRERTTKEVHTLVLDDEARVAEDARFDGIFVLRTNTTLDPLQAMLRYRELQGVEQLFRSAKSLLATRPIFHKCDATIRGHVFCSFLALVLRKELQDRLAAAGLAPEWAEVLGDLDRLQEVDVAQDGKRFVLRTPVTGCSGKLFRTLGVALPPNIRDAAPQPPETLAGSSQP